LIGIINPGNKGALNVEVDSIKLLKYTDPVCGLLWLWNYRQKPSAIPADISAILLLDRCQDAEANIIKELPAKQKQQGLYILVLQLYRHALFLEVNG
jgi:hypothetical protein